MVRQTANRRAWTANFVILGVVALSAGAWGLSRWQPFEHEGAAGIEWPNNVKVMAEFVEQVNGRAFLEPVRIVYVQDREEFERRVAPERTEEERRRAEELSATDEAVGRALGFWDERVEIIKAADDLRSTVVGDVAWVPAEDALLINAKSKIEIIDESAQADVVQMLTEQLDEQHFHVSERLAAAPDAQSFQALAGIAIANGIWARDQWVAQLDQFHRGRLEDIDGEHRSDRQLVVGKYNSAFRSLRSSPQMLGVPFVRALHELGDRTAIETAFGPEGPDALDQLSLPATKYVRRDVKEPVEAPDVPNGGELLYRRQLGPYGLFLLMTNELPSVAALEATDGWGNDAWTAYRLDDRVCVDGRIVADSADDADRIEVGLNAFGDAAPDEAEVLIGRDDDTLLVSACDPARAALRGISDAELEPFALRASTLDDQIRYTGLPETSECAVRRWFSTHDSDEDPSPGFANIDGDESVDDFMAECSTSR